VSHSLLTFSYALLTRVICVPFFCLNISLNYCRNNLPLLVLCLPYFTDCPPRIRSMANWVPVVCEWDEVVQLHWEHSLHTFAEGSSVYSDLPRLARTSPQQRKQTCILNYSLLRFRPCACAWRIRMRTKAVGNICCSITKRKTTNSHEVDN
jgi:hypothetical protein